MMQKNEYRRNENKRSFRTERKPVKNAGQDTYKVKSAQDAHKVKSVQDTYKVKSVQDAYKVKNAQKPGKQEIRIVCARCPDAVAVVSSWTSHMRNSCSTSRSR